MRTFPHATKSLDVAVVRVISPFNKGRVDGVAIVASADPD
jgi:hypothetical protein